MTRLAILLVVCLGLALVLRRRPVHLVCLALALWFAVPAIAAKLVTGIGSGPIAFHPSTWLLLLTAVVQLLINTETMVAALARHVHVFLAVFVFLAGALLTSQALGTGGTRLMGDQVVGPVLAFWLVVAFGTGRAALLTLVRNTVLVVVAVECLLSIVQFGVGNIIVFSAQYESLYWFNPLRFTRWMGSTDSPLVFSLAVSAAAPLTMGVRNGTLRFGLLMLFLVGTVITQSRTGVAVMAVVLIYVIVRAAMGVLTRLMYVILLIIAGVALVGSSIVSGLTTRLSNDTGSSEARGLALRWFMDHWTDYLVLGQGLTSSYRIALEAGLQTSLESSVLMYAVDAGVLLAVVYFGSQIVLLARHARYSTVPGLAVAALIGLLLQHTFSGVASSSLVGVLTWTLLGLVVASDRRDLAPEDLARRGMATEVAPMSVASARR